MFGNKKTKGVGVASANRSHKGMGRSDVVHARGHNPHGLRGRGAAKTRQILRPVSALSGHTLRQSALERLHIRGNDRMKRVMRSQKLVSVFKGQTAAVRVDGDQAGEQRPVQERVRLERADDRETGGGLPEQRGGQPLGGAAQETHAQQSSRQQQHQGRTVEGRIRPSAAPARKFTN